MTEQKPKFSPGPWRMIKMWPRKIYGADNRIVADIALRIKGDWTENHERSDANAVLINAAPNMLAMLKRVRAFITDGKVLAELNELLAEVQGEEVEK